MISKLILSFFVLGVLLISCAGSKRSYSPAKKYPKELLLQDFTLLKKILETKHPSLYWYTSKDSIDMYFDEYQRTIKDSMTEQEFGWKVIAPLTNKIHCGHTSFGMSNAYNKWVNNKKLPSFPLFLKCWNDTMVVTANLNRKDTVLKRGALITAINGLRNKELKQTLFQYLTEDGNADNVNYLRLSNSFPYYHRNVFGISEHYIVQYMDSNGIEQSLKIPLYEPAKDSVNKASAVRSAKKNIPKTKQQRLRVIRSLDIDTTNNTAIITLNSFTTGGLRKFFRQSFRFIKNATISSVILDLRSNGGGRINLSTLLTRYVTRVPFRVTDSAFAVTKSLSPYSKYIKGRFINNLGLFFLTKKKADGLFHLGHWEKKFYYPKRNNHFDGDLYVLTNGSTFSASALFCNVVKGQSGIKLAGEETGGGWYGNNGILIPDITLPNTRLRVRLPLFRLVQYKHGLKDGRGVVPDIYIGTNYKALVKGIDKKMQVVMELIKEKNAISNK